MTLQREEKAQQQSGREATHSETGRGERLIFVGGAPRSGTTLVQNMLDCHSEIYGGPEFLHIPDIVRLRTSLRASIARKWIDLFCTNEKVDDMTAAMIEDFLLPLADAQGVRFLSEKSPMNVLVFPELIELFPQARYIFVVRDPRAVVSSLLEVGAKARAKNLTPPPFTRNVAAAIAYTRQCMGRGFKALHAAPKQVHLIVYENLVRDPKANTQAICEFLGIPWEPAMILPANKKHAGEQAITVHSEELWYDADAYYKNPEVDRVDRWKQQLSQADQVAIGLSFQNSRGVDGLGYDFGDRDYSPIARLAGYGKSRVFRVQQRILQRLGRFLTSLQIPPT